jgi:AAA15 family ATPase/GTPase
MIQLPADSRFRKFLQNMVVLRPPDFLNPRIEQRNWRRLISDRRDKILTATMNRVFGIDAESFQLMPNNSIVVLFPTYSVPLDSLGDGFRSTFRLLVAMSLIEKTALMLEELECHQHPGSLDRLALAISRQAKSNAIQLFITTHSADCIRSLAKAAGECELKLAVFHLSLDDGKQIARRLSADSLSTLVDTGVDVRCLDLYA